MDTVETIVDGHDDVKNKIKHKIKNYRSKSRSSCLYGLGAIGAATYFVTNATGFWMSVLGLLKGLVWPAIIVYEVMIRLGA